MFLFMFTSQGPVAKSIPVDTMEHCLSMVKTADSLIGKRIPGMQNPDGTQGEQATILDAQPRCMSFTQQEHA